MKIFSNTKNLNEYLMDLLMDSKSGPLTNRQVRIENYLINVSYGAAECLVFDENDTIIDGFVENRGGDYYYKGMSFYKLLGGNDGIATPVDKSIYENIIVPDNFEHPYEKRMKSMLLINS